MNVEHATYELHRAAFSVTSAIYVGVALSLLFFGTAAVVDFVMRNMTTILVVSALIIGGSLAFVVHEYRTAGDAEISDVGGDVDGWPLVVFSRRYDPAKNEPPHEPCCGDN